MVSLRFPNLLKAMCPRDSSYISKGCVTKYCSNPPPSPFFFDCIHHSLPVRKSVFAHWEGNPIIALSCRSCSFSLGPANIAPTAPSPIASRNPPFFFFFPRFASISSSSASLIKGSSRYTAPDRGVRVDQSGLEGESEWVKG